MRKGLARLLTVVFATGLLAGAFLPAFLGTERVAPVGISAWILGEGDTFRPRPKTMPKEDRTYGIEVWVAMPDMPSATSDGLKGWVNRITAGVGTTFAHTRTAIRYVDEERLPSRLKARAKGGNPPDVVIFTPDTFGDYGVYQMQLQSFLTDDERKALYPNAVKAVTRSEKGWMLGWPLGIRFPMWAVDPKGLERMGIDAAAWAGGGRSTAELADAARKAGYSGLVSFCVPDRLMAFDIPSLQGLMDGTRDGVVGKAPSTPLWDFRSGRVLSLAPVEPRLADALGVRAGTGPLLLPSPIREASGAVAAVSVFRGNRRHFKGFDHLRVCVELARRMSEAAQAPDGPCQSLYLLPAVEGQQPMPALDAAKQFARNLDCRGPFRVGTVIKGMKAMRKAMDGMTETGWVARETLTGFSADVIRAYGIKPDGPGDGE